MDAWTSPNTYAFIGITVHFIDQDWDLQQVLIDLVELSGPHSGKNISSVFYKSCKELGILQKVRIYFILSTARASIIRPRYYFNKCW
jgi:hypothetical protein